MSPSSVGHLIVPPVSEGVGVFGVEPDGSPSDEVYFFGTVIAARRRTRSVTHTYYTYSRTHATHSYTHSYTHSFKYIHISVCRSLMCALHLTRLCACVVFHVQASLTSCSSTT